LDRFDTPDFLESLTHWLCSESKFIMIENDEPGRDDKIVTRWAPVYFIRKRIGGMLSAIDEIIKTIEKTGYMPKPITEIFGSDKVEIQLNDSESSIDEQLAALNGDNVDIACIEQPKYANKTFGVISLLGDDQAKLIQQLILRIIEPDVIEERRILCGNASHFQGDERDVVFLSMVDSNEGDSPFRFTGEGMDQSTKQRYNVAVSRARDQLWVVHSLDYSKDLKPGDIRRDLLEYCENPKAVLRSNKIIDANAESPFEEAVGKSLVAAGYHVTPQWEVGAYRIDIVVQYNGKKIAIECDEEKYHSGEEKIREDMVRQTILERLGWRFIRIRGSEYYRNPEDTMARVIKELNDNGIFPEKSYEQAPIISSELLLRVKNRAMQILDEWHDNYEKIPNNSEGKILNMSLTSNLVNKNSSSKMQLHM